MQIFFIKLVCSDAFDLMTDTILCWKNSCRVRDSNPDPPSDLETSRTSRPLSLGRKDGTCDLPYYLHA